MANVYATLADGGYRNTPIAITKVVFPDGYTDTNWGTPHRVKVPSNGVTAEETEILHENVESGTATRSAIDCPTAAKTGTTSNLVDAWLDGYTPDYSTSVWMGYPNKLIPMTDVHGEPQQGGYLPAEIWHDYMAGVTEGKPCTPFPTPTEPISYQPFFGKYATTGQTSVEGNLNPANKKSRPRTVKEDQPAGDSRSTSGHSRIRPATEAAEHALGATENRANAPADCHGPAQPTCQPYPKKPHLPSGEPAGPNRHALSTHQDHDLAQAADADADRELEAGARKHLDAPTLVVWRRTL